MRTSRYCRRNRAGGPGRCRGVESAAPNSRQGVLLEPIGQTGEAIYPAFEGWGPTQDGGRVLLLGYFNRNKAQELDIPIGPDNNIGPGGPDFGQPTHFHTGRQYGVFAIPIPKDFGDKKLTWTIRANGQTAVGVVLGQPRSTGSTSTRTWRTATSRRASSCSPPGRS